MTTNSPRLTLLLAVVIATTSVGCGEKLTPEQREVSAVFDTYREALKRKDGDRVAELVGPETLDYYRDLLDLARYGDREAFAERSLLDQVSAMVIRTQLTPEQLKTLDASRVLARLTTDDTEPPNPLMDLLVIGELTITGGRADATMRFRGQQLPAPLHIAFVRVDDAWKIELAGLIDFTNTLLVKQMEEEGIEMTPEFVQLFVRLALSEDPDEDDPTPAPIEIFDPPMTRAGDAAPRPAPTAGQAPPERAEIPTARPRSAEPTETE